MKFKDLVAPTREGKVILQNMRRFKDKKNPRHIFLCSGGVAIDKESNHSFLTCEKTSITTDLPISTPNKGYQFNPSKFKPKAKLCTQLISNFKTKDKLSQGQIQGILTLTLKPRTNYVCT